MSKNGEFRGVEKLFDRNVHLAVMQLDRVIDLNYYAIPSTADSNNRWRNIGLD
jgi:ribonucleoside-diphosphate reductase alpha chain